MAKKLKIRYADDPRADRRLKELTEQIVSQYFKNKNVTSNRPTVNYLDYINVLEKSSPVQPLPPGALPVYGQEKEDTAQA